MGSLTQPSGDRERQPDVGRHLPSRSGLQWCYTGLSGVVLWKDESF